MSKYKTILSICVCLSVGLLLYGLFQEGAFRQFTQTNIGWANDVGTLRNNLKNKNYTAIEETIDPYIMKYENGEVSGNDISNLFLAFSVVDPELEANIESWLENDTWNAKVAASNYYSSMAWAWRGGEFYSRIPDVNREKFKQYLLKAYLVLPDDMGNKLKDALVTAQKIEYLNEGAPSKISEMEFIGSALTNYADSRLVLESIERATSEKWGDDKALRQQVVYELDKMSLPEESVLYYRGEDARNDRNYPVAIQNLQKAISINPNEARYHYSLSRAYFGTKQDDKALEEINKVLKHWPHSSNAYRIRANAHFRLKKFDEAGKDIDKALSYSPYDRKMNSLAVSIYGKLNDTAKLNQAVDRSLHFAQADRYQLAKVADSLFYNTKQWDKAEDLYKSVVKIEPLDVAGNYGLSVIYGRLQSCNIVKTIYDYMKGCALGVGKTKRKCASQYINWAHSAVNHLKANQKCAEINEYDFSAF